LIKKRKGEPRKRRRRAWREQKAQGVIHGRGLDVRRLKTVRGRRIPQRRGGTGPLWGTDDGRAPI